MTKQYTLKLNELLNELEKHIPTGEYVALNISQKPVNWHIDHSLRVIIGIGKSLLKSNPSKYKWVFNLKRLVIFSLGKIPRGKGRAPKVVVPNEHITTDEIKERLIEAKTVIEAIKNLPKHHFFEHPYFGKLATKKSKHFLIIHTQHHLHIISDILKYQA